MRPLESSMADANGFVYLRERYYDPVTGRFPNLDPVEGTMEQPMSLNRYSYVQNNPANLTDPSGLTFTCTGDAQSACEDLDDALQRGQNLGLPQIQHTGPITSDDLVAILPRDAQRG